MMLASGRVAERAELGEVVADPQVVVDEVGELGDDPACQRDVARLDIDAGGAGESLHDGQ